MWINSKSRDRQVLLPLLLLGFLRVVSGGKGEGAYCSWATWALAYYSMYVLTLASTRARGHGGHAGPQSPQSWAVDRILLVQEPQLSQTHINLAVPY